MKRKLIIKKDIFPLKKTFSIAHGSRDFSEVIYVKIKEGSFFGEGESFPYDRYDETNSSVIKQIEGIKDKIENGATINDLQNLLPAGAARNAIDLALWNLKAKKQNKEVWQIANLPKPKSIETAYTISIGNPTEIFEETLAIKNIYPILKIKLAGDNLDIERIRAVRQASLHAKIVLDANESWNDKNIKNLIKIAEENNVFMIEQPLKTGKDAILTKIKTDIIICADESVHTTSNLKELVSKYDMINIKLDKTGGLTEAINLYHEAKKLNLQIMIGCMISSSLGIKPAYFLAQNADFVDLDAPLLLAKDRKTNLQFDGNKISILS